MENQRRAQKHVGHAFSQFVLSKTILNNLSQFNLKPITKLVLLYLCDCYNPKKSEIFPKQKTIANKLGVSEASVIRAIQELHKEGLIISERKYTNLYKFTAKIACYCPQNKIFCEDKMQDEILQIETNKLANCELHVHEQTTEQIQEQEVVKNNWSIVTGSQPTNYGTGSAGPVKVDDYKILKDYAVKNGAKNVQAYVNSLKKNGFAENIIARQKEKENADRRAAKEIEETSEMIATWGSWTGDNPQECAAWVALKAKLKGELCQK